MIPKLTRKAWYAKKRVLYQFLYPGSYGNQCDMNGTLNMLQYYTPDTVLYFPSCI